MKKSFFFTAIFVAVAFVFASATIINVPDDYTTIQESIDACFDGDIVRIAPGTYLENIDFSGKDIVVGSWFLDDGDPSFISSTIIDGNQSGSVVSFLNGEDNSAVITGFTIQNGLAQYGGGIACESSNPTIINNTINGNSATYIGGGIFCESSSPTIINNTISGNSSDVGGGIDCYGSSATITNNSINGNSAGYYGGGIYCGGGSDPTIINNTINGNSAGFGGGIYCHNSSPLITNTIFWDDSAPTGPEIYLSGSSPVITYCDVQGGWAGETNIDCDPMFCDPESGNFYLDAVSCCVGAGGGGFDIGAFGIGCGYIINIPADYETIQEGVNASSNRDIVRIAPGTYLENIDFSGKDIVVGSWFLDAGDPSYISSTIIDGNQSGSVVSFLNGEDNSAVITGFTIQNGNAENGGGIFCSSSSPTIINNTISGNTAGNWGGGIYCQDNSNSTISNNTVSGNSADYGGGISFYNNCNPLIVNSIFWANNAVNDGNDIYIHPDYPSTPTFAYCDVQGGWEGEGNLDCDPMFCDPENGNFYLDAASCCVGAGEGGVDIGAFGVGCGEEIPTLSEWGMILLALLLLAAGTIAVIRRRRTADAREM